MLVTEEGVVRPLTEPAVEVGRGRFDDGRPRFPVRIETVSRRHFEVALIDGVHHCRDLGSSNGTVLRRDDRLIEVGDRPVPLRPGDRICTLDGEEPIVRFQAARSTVDP